MARHRSSVLLLDDFACHKQNRFIDNFLKLEQAPSSFLVNLLVFFNHMT